MNWPEPQSRGNVASLSSCNYLKECIPGYLGVELHLRESAKQGVDFKRYGQDKKARAAFVEPKGALVERRVTRA